MVSLPPLGAGLPIAFWGLLLIVPIIILYLLKPKPRQIKFPSVMFILNAEKSKRLRSFLKKIIKDPLLVLQLLIIAMLVSVVAQPYFIAPKEENVVENSVIILDSSASMQATDVLPTRFERAREIAKDIISKMNEESVVSIVLAENVPIILAKDLKRDAALLAADQAFHSDSPTNVGDAILFSRTLLPRNALNKKMYVLSDLSPGDGADVKLAGKIVSQDNVSVNYVKINSEGENAGIIDINAKRFLTNRNKLTLTFTVANHFMQDKEVEAEIFVDDQPVKSIKNTIGAGSQKLYIYEGDISETDHRIKVSLKNLDTFPADDSAYAYLPGTGRYKILLVTDDGSDLYLKYALQSSKDVDLKVAIPPVIPQFGDYDAVIIGEFREEFILPRTFRDLRDYVGGGGHLIFLASSEFDQLSGPDIDPLLPIVPEQVITRNGRDGERIDVLINHEILSDVVPKGSSTFPNILVTKYVKATEKNGSVTVAQIAGSPAVSFKTEGKGRVAYVGINPNPAWSNFYYSSSFPIFWLQLINYVARSESNLGVSNFKTGEYMPMIKDTLIRSPSGKSLNSTNLILDESGFYELEHAGTLDRVGVSIANEKESDIAKTMDVDVIGDKDYKYTKASIEAKNDMVPYLLALVMVLLSIEIVYYKRRQLL